MTYPTLTKKTEYNKTKKYFRKNKKQIYFKAYIRNFTSKEFSINQ